MHGKEEIKINLNNYEKIDDGIGFVAITDPNKVIDIKGEMGKRFLEMMGKRKRRKKSFFLSHKRQEQLIIRNKITELFFIRDNEYLSFILKQMKKNFIYISNLEDYILCKHYIPLINLKRRTCFNCRNFDPIKNDCKYGIWAIKQQLKKIYEKK